MKITLSTSRAADELCADEYANWSRAGAYALAEYLEELEDDAGTEIEFDRVAIRCDFSEYKSLIEWACEYFGGAGNATQELEIEIGMDGEIEDPDGVNDIIREYISDNGTLIEFDGGIIASSF